MKQQAEKKEPHRAPDLQSPSRREKASAKDNAGRVTIHFYTDPLCCWSWAFEKPWRQLLEKYGDQVSYRYVMCGMIPNWNSYNDAMNAVSKPLQMGPVWMHASEVTQVQMRYDIWHRDPPSSSFPPCIAVKTAGLQSQRAEDEYLFELRRHLMEDGANISKTQALFEVAARTKSVDLEKFRVDWNAGAGNAPFRDDLQKARFHGIGRFPTLTFTDGGGKGIMIVGYRPLDVLEQAFKNIAPNASSNAPVNPWVNR